MEPKIGEGVMRVYLAARYSRREELAAYADELRALDIEVTSRWLTGAHNAPSEDDNKNAIWQQYAIDDVEDVLAADTVVSFTETPLTPTLRGGRHVEYGIAAHAGKRLVLVGERENIFHWLPGVECYPTWQDAKVALAEVV